MRNNLNIFYNAISSFVTIAVPLAIIPILTSNLGLDTYGNYVALIARNMFILVMLEFGLGMYVSKLVAQNADNNNELNQITKAYLCIKIASWIFVSMLFIGLEQNLTSIILIVLLFFQILDVSPIFNGLNDYKYISSLKVLSKIALITSVTMVDFNVEGLNKALSLQILPVFIVAVMGWYKLSQKLDFSPIKWDHIKKLLLGGLPYYGSKLFVNVYQQSSTYLVSLVLPAALVALYSIALQCYKVGQVVVGSVSKVLYTSTITTKNYGYLKKITLYSILLYVAGIPLVVYFGKPILMALFDIEKLDLLYKLCLIFYLSMLFVFVSSYWGYPAMVPINKDLYAHIGVMIPSISYFIGFLFLYIFNGDKVVDYVFCIVLADFLGMLARLYFARKFKVI